MMKLFYHIIPSNDGYHYIALDDSGNHIELSKNSNDYKHNLLFKTATEANDYICKFLDIKNYKVEALYLNETFYTDLPK